MKVEIFLIFAVYLFIFQAKCGFFFTKYPPSPPPCILFHSFPPPHIYRYHQNQRDNNDEREELFALAIAAVNGTLVRSSGFDIEARG